MFLEMNDGQPQLFRICLKVYEMIISKPDVSAAERIGKALFKLQSKLRELEENQHFVMSTFNDQ